MKCSTRAVVQLFLTGLTLATAITSFTFSFVFGTMLNQLIANFQSQTLQSNILPCIRNTLNGCTNDETDKCWDYCCPAGYYCSRSPIVGLTCQYGNGQCGDFNWCRDFADILHTCPTDVCDGQQRVQRVTSFAYILAAAGIFLDLVDIIIIFTLPDTVVFKAAINILSSLVKWLAFGLVLGAGILSYMSDLATAKCYNDQGMQLVADAAALFVFYCIVQVVSAALSLVLSPFSAYYGGKLQGVPYVK